MIPLLPIIPLNEITFGKDICFVSKIWNLIKVSEIDLTVKDFEWTVGKLFFRSLV